MAKHCPGCSHPTICRTHGCAAEEARRNKEAKAVSGNEMRRAFEAWFLEPYPIVPGWYLDPIQQSAWEAWQAGYKHAQERKS